MLTVDHHLPCAFVVYITALYKESMKRKGLFKCNTQRIEISEVFYINVGYLS